MTTAALVTGHQLATSLCSQRAPKPPHCDDDDCPQTKVSQVESALHGSTEWHHRAAMVDATEGLNAALLRKRVE